MMNDRKFWKGNKLTHIQRKRIKDGEKEEKKNKGGDWCELFHPLWKPPYPTNWGRPDSVLVRLSNDQNLEKFAINLYINYYAECEILYGYKHKWIRLIQLFCYMRRDKIYLYVIIYKKTKVETTFESFLTVSSISLTV